MPAKTTMRPLLMCAAIGILMLAEQNAFGQRRGGGRSASRSRSSSRSSSVRYSGRSSASRKTASRTTATRTTGARTTGTRTTATRTTTGAAYGSVRHGGTYGTASGGAVRTPYGGAAHVEGPRGREATAVKTPWGGAVNAQGYGGRSVTASRGPYGGGVHSEGRYGRSATAVWGPNGAVVAGSGPRGAGVAVSGNYYRGGAVVRRPAGYSTVVVGGTNYYGWGGHCYNRVVTNGSVTYVGIRPPLGWAVAILPAAYRTVVYTGTTYYVSDDVYYVKSVSAGEVSYVVSAPPADATPEPGLDPFATLRRMSDYLGKRKEFTVATVDTMDNTLPTGQKIQLQTRRAIQVKRPHAFRVEVEGDVADRQVVYDGEKVTLLNRRQATYGTIDAPKKIDEALDFMAERYGMSVPLADLFYSSPYDAVMPSAETGRHLGKIKLDGVECEHLVFEGQLIDWEVWIETGDRPLPRKMVITYKTVAGAPRYRALLNDWDLSPRLSSKSFKFKAPKGATRVDVLPISGG